MKTFLYHRINSRYKSIYMIIIIVLSIIGTRILNIWVCMSIQWNLFNGTPMRLNKTIRFSEVSSLSTCPVLSFHCTGINVKHDRTTLLRLKYKFNLTWTTVPGEGDWLRCTCKSDRAPPNMGLFRWMGSGLQ